MSAWCQRPIPAAELCQPRLGVLFLQECSAFSASSSFQRRVNMPAHPQDSGELWRGGTPSPEPLSKWMRPIRLGFEAARSAEGVTDADDYAVLVVRRAGRGGDAVLRLYLQAFKGDRHKPGAREGGVGPLRAREPGVHRAQCRAAV